MKNTPKGMRIHIGLFGRRNAGKSSLLNALTRQNASIVSDIAGTTTDPVEKPMELLPLGPVLFIDTAGIDDMGALGEMRIAKTRQTLDRADIAIIVTEVGVWTEFEELLLRELAGRNATALIAVNKADLLTRGDAFYAVPAIYRNMAVAVSAMSGDGLSDLRGRLFNAVSQECLNPPAIAGDLVGPGGLAILVVPVDKEAPKGRLILPQAQVIRDLLDSDACCMVVKERELRLAIDSLNVLPKLVVTDSQAFLKVAADTPKEVPMTSFSILFARYKGDLNAMVEGAMAVGKLAPGDRILIAEACSHHPIAEDIGTVKIPRWLTQYVGGSLEFVHWHGHDFPEDLAGYRLVIHCGACVMNRREVVNRIRRCALQGVPVTNYGLAIAFSLGVFERALRPFPAAHEIFRSSAARKDG
jgi:[FeFe] hydrogenase H-cluster maturation GTPase HydF